MQRLGWVTTVAKTFTAVRQQGAGRAYERALRLIGYLGAALVLACASFARLTSGDADGHLGLEVAAAAAAAVAVLLLDRREGVSNRGLLAGVLVGWIAAAGLLVSDGDVVFCGQMLAGVTGAAAILQAVRRLPWRAPRGGG